MRSRIPRRLCSIALFALSVVTATAATFTVVNANDNGAGTLRQAILDANATPGIDTIAFNIPPGGSTSITITSATFVVTDPVVIDGTTQPGFAGIPVVELTSSFEAPWLQCLQIEAGNSVVRGLSFHGLKGDAVILRDGGTNVIEGNMFGLHRDGVSSHGNAYRGIILINSSFNTIGGTNAAQRNVVAASANAGINLLLGSSYNRIIGNYVGTDVTGTKARGNYRGVTVSVGTNNVIGGAGPGERNIISGSGWTGVQLWIGESNRVVGNYIGTDVSGRFALTNYDVGIYVVAHNFAVIGGDRPGEGNLVSGNRNGGIAIENGNNTFSNRVAGNFIGVDVTGTNALPNLNYGLYLSGVSGLQVGGATVGARNVIAGNRNAGILISGGFGARNSHGVF